MTCTMKPKIPNYGRCQGPSCVKRLSKNWGFHVYCCTGCRDEFEAALSVEEYRAYAKLRQELINAANAKKS
jgi:hypothetical protein